VGRHARASLAHGRTPGSPCLAKKALGIRPRPDAGADARPKAGRLDNGRHGKARSAKHGTINWPGTLLGGRPHCREDVRYHLRTRAAHELWLVIVDASASTRRHGALSDAKGLLAQLFDDAYRQRARMALLTASGPSPTWQVQGLKAAKGLTGWLAQLGAGGGTPLLAALSEAGHWLQARRQRYPAERQRLLVITDGRLKDIAGLPALDCPGLLVDIERGPITLGRAAQLALALNLDYRHIDSL